MAFKILEQYNKGGRSSREATVRVAAYKGMTEIRVSRGTVEKLGWEIKKGKYDMPITISLGTDEHQGLVQISSDGKGNRTVQASNGHFSARIGRADLAISNPDESLNATPVTFLIEHGVLILELPSTRYQVADSAKAYMRGGVLPKQEPQRQRLGAPAGL